MTAEHIRHGIEFEEAKTVVDSPFSLDSRDAEAARKPAGVAG